MGAKREEEEKNEKESRGAAKHAFLTSLKNPSNSSSSSSSGSGAIRAREPPRPVPRARHRPFLVLTPLPRDAFVERVVRVRRRQQRLHRDQHGPDLQGRGPLVLEDVEADAAELVDVGVVDLGEEADLFGRGRARVGVGWGGEREGVRETACVRERGNGRKGGDGGDSKKEKKKGKLKRERVNSSRFRLSLLRCPHLWCRHGIVLGEEELELEDAAWFVF